MSRSIRIISGTSVGMILLAGVVLEGCADPVVGEVRTLRPLIVENSRLPPLASADFAQASLAFSPGSGELALQLERGGVRRRLWPSPIARAMRALQAERDNGGAGLFGGLAGRTTTPGTTSPGSGPSSGRPAPATAEGVTLIDRGWLAGRMRSRRVAVDGRIFYFLLTSPEYVEALPVPRREQSHSPYVFLAVEEGGDASPATFVTDGEPHTVHENVKPRLVVPFAGPGEFAAVPWEDTVAVIYRDRGGIFARRLSTRGDAPTFGSERWQIAAAPNTIHRYRLLARTDEAGTVHLLWAISAADESTTLHYCRLIPRGRSRCRHPVELSRSIAVDETSGSLNLMIQGERVYVSWIDTRYEERGWTRRNFAKLFVAGSTDGGQTFDAPVSVNRPRDNSSNALYAVTLPAGSGGVLVFWTEETVQAGLWRRLPFQAGWLDAGLDNLHVGAAAVPGRHIGEMIVQAVSRHHETLGEEK